MQADLFPYMKLVCNIIEYGLKRGNQAQYPLIASSLSSVSHPRCIAVSTYSLRIKQYALCERCFALFGASCISLFALPVSLHVLGDIEGRKLRKAEKYVELVGVLCLPPFNLLGLPVH